MTAKRSSRRKTAPETNVPPPQLVRTKLKIGSMCAGDIRLLPIDVGFDLRATRHRVGLQPDTDGKTVAYMDGEQPMLMHGPRAAIVAELTRCGYVVEDAHPAGD